MYDNNRIKVTNTAIIIDNYTLGESEQLEKPFRLYDMITHKFVYKGFYYDADNKRLYLPSGMDLWYVRRALDEKYYSRREPAPYKEIDDIKIKFKPRDDRQIEALRFMCGVDEYENNKYASQLTVALVTGFGKTYCSIATMSYYKLKSIVITGSNSLLTQWKQEILNYTNLKDNDVVMINGSDQCNMILSGSSNKANNGKIFLCSHGTLRSFGERFGWNKVGELIHSLGIGLKFYDEAHTNFDNMLMIDFFTNVYKTFYVTATPQRSDFKENHIFQISLKNVPMIDLFDEDNDPHTSYIAIKWNSKPSPQQISACKNKYGLDRMKYINYVTKKPEFYDMLRIIMDMVIKCKGRVLFYIGTNEGILRVYQWIGANYPEFLGDIGIFTSLLSKEDKMKDKNKKLLLSTTKSAGLGEHIQGLKMTIVLAEPFKSEVLARQTLGRTRDNNTKYIELVDMGFFYIKKYYFAKLPIFNKYATDVSDTVIEQTELSRRAQNIEESRRHHQESPIELYDTRFDIDYDKKEETKGPICPIEFIGKNNNPFIR